MIGLDRKSPPQGKIFGVFSGIFFLKPDLFRNLTLPKTFFPRFPRDAKREINCTSPNIHLSRLYELLSKKRAVTRHIWLQTRGQVTYGPTELICATKTRGYLYTSPEKKTWKDSGIWGHIASRFSMPTPAKSCPNFHLEFEDFAGFGIENRLVMWPQISESFKVFFSGEV